MSIRSRADRDRVVARARTGEGLVISVEFRPPRMKNQYCGDVGDPGKFALLRSLQREFPEERIGILWYLTRDDLAGGERKMADSPFTPGSRLAIQKSTGHSRRLRADSGTFLSIGLSV